jgi:methyl-accepting chemotaxis protein
MRLFRGLTISNKLLMIILPIILLCFLLLAQITTYKVKATVREETIRQLKGTVTSLSDMVAIANESVIQDANSKMDGLLNHYRGTFSLDPGRVTRIGDQDAPLLRFNGVPVNLNDSQVDEFSRQNENSVATVFVRKGDEFLRIATSLKKEDGTRAVGTTLGADHPACSALMRGETYIGKAKLFGHNYMTKYLPIRDAGKGVIGVLFVGTNIDNIIQKFEKTIASVKVGETGYAYVLDAGSTQTRGQIMMHPDHTKVGKNVLEFKDAKGRQFSKEMLETKS